MSLKLGLLAPGLLAAALPLAHVPVAAAEPVWPVAGRGVGRCHHRRPGSPGLRRPDQLGERCQLGAAVLVQGHRDP
jgi:hypothetical protein